MRRHHTSLGTVLALTSWIPNSAPAQDDDPSTWMPDGHLRTAVRASLALAESEALTQARVQGLTHLRAAGRGIGNLKGIEHATNLAIARLAHNQISDLGPLSGLTSLRKLRLQDNHVTSLASLGGLTNLTELFLFDNQITDVAPLGQLVKLEKLLLAGNALANAHLLSSLPKLTDIDIAIPDPPQTDPPPQADPPPEADPPPQVTPSSSPPADTEPPGVTISVPSAVQNGAFSVTITFTEAVSDFVQGDVSLTGSANASITEWKTTDNTTYTATVAPSTSGQVSLRIPAGVATDAANNPNTASLTYAVTSLVAQQQMVDMITPVCDRTTQVKDAIVAAVPGVSACAGVTQTHLGAISTLRLSYMNITTLKDGDFDGLSGLRRLVLAGNPLTGLPEDVFDGLSALETLYLQNNQLTSLHADVFDGLSALKHLRLFNNQLSSLPAGVFDGLSSLEKLMLLHNQLTSLPADVFDGLSALKMLFLYENRLTSLHEDVFDGLSALEQLVLSSNRLTSLHQDVFGELSGLKALLLSECALGSLPAAIFGDLSALGVLALGNNQLTTLPADLFDGLSALEDLRLLDNQLSSLPDGIFSGLTSLRNLSLEGNSVDPMPIAVSLRKVGTNQFKAVAPAGAPFDMVLPLNVAAGGISGGAGSITIPTASVESDPLTLTRTPGATGPVTVDIGPLPPVPNHHPRTHSGYVLAKSTDLPLQYTGALAKPALPASANPGRTALLPNFPNPFNPETWLPYHLARAGHVRITIYDARGAVVRRLDLGHQQAGYYTGRHRAAYWDGRDGAGGGVASGIYLYQLRAGDLSFLRRMLMLK